MKDLEYSQDFSPLIGKPELVKPPFEMELTEEEVNDYRLVLDKIDAETARITKAVDDFFEELKNRT